MAKRKFTTGAAEALRDKGYGWKRIARELGVSASAVRQRLDLNYRMLLYSLRKDKRRHGRKVGRPITPNPKSPSSQAYKIRMAHELKLCHSLGIRMAEARRIVREEARRG